MGDVIAKTMAFGVIGVAALMVFALMLAPLDDEPYESEENGKNDE